LGSKEYNYWALGHVHQYETLLDDPLVVFSGCIQGRHIRETGPKGCLLVTVDDNGRPEPEFRPLDVIRWVIAEVDSSSAESAYEVVARFGQQLEKLMDENEGLPLVIRVVIKGETPGHSELLTDVEHWCNEIRSAAIDVGGGQVWVEKIKFDTTLPASQQDLQKGDGAIGELVSLFDEMSSNPDMVQALSDEFSDIEKKIPKELKADSDSLKFDDFDWLTGILKQVRPMLLQRLMHKGVAE
jgi:DNA repair exonuclease SbcCD nuclease subunit